MPRLEDIKARIGNVEQIEDVIVAMRAMAAAHSREARHHLAAIRKHEETIARSMGTALSLGGKPETVGTHDGHLRIVVGAAQGFSGLYNDRIVSAVVEKEEAEGPGQLMLVGQRCIESFAERHREAVWSADMVAHSDEVPLLASRIVDALYEQIEQGAASRVDIVYAEPGAGVQPLTFRQLVPFDYARIRRGENPYPPITMIAPELLLAQLVEEYVFTEVCEALMLGFAAESEARMNAMTQARTNVRRMGQDLRRSFNQARQEEMTSEIIELSSRA